MVLARVRMSMSTIIRIQEMLERAGVHFIEDENAGFGVPYRKKA
jgi:hypothetical protein